MIRRDFWLRLVVYLVGIHGVYVIAITLLEQISSHTGVHASDIDIDLPLLIGFGLIYLSTLLKRRKHTAWSVAVLAYMFMLGLYADDIAFAVRHGYILHLVSKLFLPVICLTLLWLYRRSFTVKSDIASFGYALRSIAIIILIAFVYGTAGFVLMGRHDFGREISIPEGMKLTVGQFVLASDDPQPHTRRAALFIDSLTVVGLGALTYAVISLFQPIRARYTTQHDALQRASDIMRHYPGKSEDYFKLWPLDKSYIFDKGGSAGLAYKTVRGVALVAGDPFGDRAHASEVIQEFQDHCYGNDWLPVFVHTEPDWTSVYKDAGYTVQKLGQEAVLDLNHFASEVKGGKYFRQISNKFGREGYQAELLQPPHNKALIDRLRIISNAWLGRPGRTERGFVMGYFDEAYLQDCPIVVARDAAGTIQGFLNQIPSFDKDEANFDMLRASNESLGNSNDFLLMAFIDDLQSQGVKRLNLGLCPLSGLDEPADAESNSVITKGLRFVYSNGDRFYSFSGLRRFKAKYEPEWSNRYIAYKGGVRGFARAVSALGRAMSLKP